MDGTRPGTVPARPREAPDRGAADDLIDRYRSVLTRDNPEEPSDVAEADIIALERLRAAGVPGIVSRTAGERPSGHLVCHLVGIGEPRLLTALVPTFAGFGLAVVEQRRLHVHPEEQPRGWIDRFDLVPCADVRDAFIADFDEALEAVLRGVAEADGFNELVLTAGLSWRQITVLRAYGKYLRQGGCRFSQSYIEQALVGNPHIARLLVEVFETRFDPSPDRGDPERRQGPLTGLLAALDRDLLGVTSLDQDGILRDVLALIVATLRTSHFQVDGHGTAKPYLAVKLDPRALPNLPAPRPRSEIWVYAPRFEGVHLRFGEVARGGVRWSSRKEDFRTEILGLVKAQAVKNAVIVPAGAKGGFVCKQLPGPEHREAWLAEGLACYRSFVTALLDVTDNLVDGRLVPPTDVVRWDGDDPYLVVAADKGTATFSDIANDVADDRGFWLGDAFASGGRTGYDHKAMGITARGAWESVQRHFRELGHDPQRQDFTVVGIGDMSGDVFGNGMLLSEHIRLVAAFDHRHVFLDPDPDAARSYTERRRLFELSRSSWADYDPALLSPGGGVHPRTAKAIPISEPVRRRLGLDGSVAELAPDDLIRALLVAPVDLLWNGGIGTYVKATSESHADVGDKANDPVRVDGTALRCRVVGEGGNLGFTQRARIEYARGGGRINSDAIDNSAGVDTSDHEVNLKVLLDPSVRAGALSITARNELLAAAQEEVARLVLDNNYRHNLQLSAAEAHAAESLDRHAALIGFLEREGYLDREQEHLPDDAGLAVLDAAGRGLSRPELCVLLAHSKSSLKDDLDASDVPDDPYLREELAGYFPEPIRDRFGGELEHHPLRRQIVATSLVNDLVDHLGPGFVHRIEERTGAGTPDAVRAYVITRDVFALPGLWSSLRKSDGVVGPEAELLVLEDTARLLDHCAAWLVRNRRLPLDLAGEVAVFRDSVQALARSLTGVLDAGSRADVEARCQVLTAAGVPREAAQAAALLGPLAAAYDLVELARSRGADPVRVAAVYFSISHRLDLREVRARVSRARVDSHWTSIAQATLLDELSAQLRLLTAAALAGAPAEAGVSEVVDRWARENETALARWGTLVQELRRGDAARLAPAVVAVQILRDLAAATAADEVGVARSPSQV